jgi:hypothetical protein
MIKTFRVPFRPSFGLGRVLATPVASAATTDEQRQWVSRAVFDRRLGPCLPRGSGSQRPGRSRRLPYPLGPPDQSRQAMQWLVANTLWIITEGDRSVTTLLLPGEY